MPMSMKGTAKHHRYMSTPKIPSVAAKVKRVLNPESGVIFQYGVMLNSAGRYFSHIAGNVFGAAPKNVCRRLSKKTGTTTSSLASADGRTLEGRSRIGLCTTNVHKRKAREMRAPARTMRGDAIPETRHDTAYEPTVTRPKESARSALTVEIKYRKKHAVRTSATPPFHTRRLRPVSR